MSNSSLGRASEYKVARFFEAHGWELIVRAAASKGPADLILAHEVHGLALVQVGRTSKRLDPADRERLCHAAELCHAIPLLAQHIPRQPIVIHHINRGPASTWGRFHLEGQ
ncbi:hypothetical protein [Aeromicrobium piscarium]|uniref:hypothetical protein n=1 Tax=Aeromicrobium piscarium TaxID=2590901 RepID=UPI00163DD729|nr:hypothetical protein [Aeromicrobium piscarium]